MILFANMLLSLPKSRQASVGTMNTGSRECSNKESQDILRPALPTALTDRTSSVRSSSTATTARSSQVSSYKVTDDGKFPHMAHVDYQSPLTNGTLPKRLSNDEDRLSAKHIQPNNGDPLDIPHNLSEVRFNCDRGSINVFHDASQSKEQATRTAPLTEEQQETYEVPEESKRTTYDYPRKPQRVWSDVPRQTGGLSLSDVPRKTEEQSSSDVPSCIEEPTYANIEEPIYANIEEPTYANIEEPGSMYMYFY